MVGVVGIRGCCCNSKDNETKKTVRLSFLREQLLYDVSNYAFVAGDILDEDAEHVRHQVEDIIQPGNVDRVTRMLDLAHAECVEMLYKYADEEIPDDMPPLDDTLVEHESYDVTLRLPSSVSLSTVKLLRELIHEYMVCRVLQDWLSITYPDSSVVWEAKLEAIKDKIRAAMMSRMKAMKRKMSPF